MKYLLFIVLFASLILSACEPANQSTDGGGQESGEISPPDSDETLDAQGLTEALAAAGATVDQEDKIEQPFFSVLGQVITINGEVFGRLNAAKLRKILRDAKRRATASEQ